MKKKLVFFAYNLDIGGIEKSLVNLLKRLDNNKYDITLILEKKEGKFLKEVDSLVNIVEYKVSNCKIILFRKVYNFLKRFFWSMFNKNKFDFSCCYATYSLMGNKLAKIASKNSSIYVHSDYSYVYKDNREFCDFFLNRNIEDFRKIFFVSNESRDNFLKEFKELKSKTIVLNNFIDDKAIITLANEKISYKKQDGILFVFVGRLDESSKRITKLLYLIKELNSSSLKVNLLVVGDGPDKDIYFKYVKENDLNDVVEFVGSKSNPYPYIKLADYLILTSEYEGFPVVYLEALLLKKKIITTIDSSDEFIKMSSGYAYIISKDKKQMVKDVKKILSLKDSKVKSVDFSLMNNEKINALEKVFDEVI